MGTANPYISGLIAFGIALIPTFAWLYFLFSDTQKRKKIIALIFIGGITTVIPLLILQAIFLNFPELNVIQLIPESIPSIALGQLAVIIFLGMLEEIFKQGFLRSVDSRWLLISSVGDSIRLSMIAALGFSFAENIYPYFFSLIQHGMYQNLLGAYLIRSLFTSAMHMSVSGIFGYYYGVSKFSSDYRNESLWAGEKMYLTRFIASSFDMTESEALKKQSIFKGLFLAMGIHALFNFLVQLELVLPALILVAGSFAYLMVLVHRKTENVILIDPETLGEQQISIEKSDEDVVTELVGMWLNEKRYQDVISICERLLKRDPDNNVIKLFRAQALDKIEGNDIYHKTLTTLLDKKMVIDDQSQITRWIELQKQNGKTPQKNFQNTPEYKKFLEDIAKEKASASTFSLDLNK